MPTYQRKGKLARVGVSCITAVTAFACVELGSVDEETTIASVSTHISTDTEVRVLYDSARVSDTRERIEALGVRVAGGAEEASAATLIAERFRGLGLPVATETFKVIYYVEHNASIRTPELGFLPFSSSAATRSPAGVVSGRVINCGTGETAEEFPPGLSGNIALMGQSSLSTEEKVQNAYEAGASAVILISDDDAPVSTHFGILKLPTIQLTSKDAKTLAAALSRSPTRNVTVEVDTDCEERTSRNIVATLPGNSSESDTLYVGAHYDSSFGEGARHDNAQTVAIMLETARFLATGLRPKATVKFVAFGGNEVGRIGERAYAKRHQSELERGAIAFLTLDGVSDQGRVAMSRGKQAAPLVVRAFAVAQAARLPVPRFVPNSDSANSPFEDMHLPVLALRFDETTTRLQRGLSNGFEVRQGGVIVRLNEDAEGEPAAPAGELVTALVSDFARNPLVRSRQGVPTVVLSQLRSCFGDECG